MKPGDLVGVNKDSYLILDTLPSEYDSRVKAMEVKQNQSTHASTMTNPSSLWYCKQGKCLGMDAGVQTVATKLLVCTGVHGRNLHN